jgi:SAM-dependent methyltransferase
MSGTIGDTAPELDSKGTNPHRARPLSAQSSEVVHLRSGDAARRSDPRALLTELYAEEMREGMPDWYLRDQATAVGIRRRIAAFDHARPYLPRSGAVLDWGCYHAADACLMRAALGDGVELHGCDFAEPGSFPAFQKYAALDYRRLTSPYELPYDDESFDAVLGSGVLEHTANDSRSLTELHRVIREGGTLILSFVPNRLSYTEFVGRRVGSEYVHLRRYGRSQIRRLLLHHGFRPQMIGYHQMVPRTAGRLWSANAALERAWPINRLASSIIAVSHRHSTM